MGKADAESALEEATLALLAELGWQMVDCYEEFTGDGIDIRARHELTVPALHACIVHRIGCGG